MWFYLPKRKLLTITSNDSYGWHGHKATELNDIWRINWDSSMHSANNTWDSDKYRSFHSLMPNTMEFYHTGVICWNATNTKTPENGIMMKSKWEIQMNAAFNYYFRSFHIISISNFKLQNFCIIMKYWNSFNFEFHNIDRML